MAECLFCMKEIEADARICPFCKKDQTTPVLQHHLPPGSMLHQKYRLGGALGEGGFGITYAGLDTVLNLRVAIKEFFPTGYVTRMGTVSAQVCELGDREKSDFFRKGRLRFLQEAQILSKFSGARAIVDVRDFFEENNTAYIVMEFVDGVTLKQYLRDHGTLSPEETLRLLTPVMESLRLLHEENVIHRDLSPDNIMISKGEVKLLDFGAARSLTGEKKTLSVLLKPGFAPEEQYRTKGKQGPWTDVYALCATMYYCITGVCPDESPDRMRCDTLRPPSALGISIDPQTEAALMKGLAVYAEDRLQSMDALLSALSQEPSEALLSEDATADMTEPPSGSGADALTLGETDLTKTAAAPEPQQETVPPTIPETEEKEKRRRTPEERQRIKKIALRSAVVAAAAGLIVAFVLFGLPPIRYSAAASQLERGDYEKAYAGFTALDGYKDAADMAKETRYRQAAALSKSGDYDNAIRLAGELGDYKEATERVLTYRYQRGLQKLQAKDYAAAAEDLDAVGSAVKDAPAKAKEAHYSLACSFEQEKNFKDAIAHYEAAGNYADAKEKLERIGFDYGFQLLNKKEYKDAYACLSPLKDNEEAQNGASEAAYRYAEQLSAKKSYAEAIDYYKKAGDYEDAAEKALDAEYSYVVSHQDNADEHVASYLPDLKEGENKLITAEDVTVTSNGKGGEKHVHLFTAGNIVPATCSANGYTNYSCKCGASATGSQTAKTAHRFVGGNCKTYGVCSACGAKATTLGEHVWGPWKPQEFTHTRSCSVCGKTETGFCDGNVAKIDAYTCGFFCSVCGNPDGRGIGEHEWVNGVCQVCNYRCKHGSVTDGVCNICGKTVG